MSFLDLKDRKILYALDTNSRQPYQRIARTVGVSKDAVIYRVKRLQEQGIIKRFHTVIDVGKLGYTCYRLYLKLQDATPEKEAEIIAFLKDQPAVTWMVSIDGEYDLGMAVYTRTTREMNDLWQVLLDKHANHIDRKSLAIFTKVSSFPRAYLLDKQRNQEEYVFITDADRVDIDETDERLLRLLASDARITVLELSKELAITPKTVTARIRALETKQVIVGYRTMFDLERLGYQYFKVHINLHNVTADRLALLRAYVKDHPNIVYDNHVLGGDDLEIEVQVRTLQELRAVIDDLKRQFSGMIKEHRYMTYIAEHKFLFLPVTGTDEKLFKHPTEEAR